MCAASVACPEPTYPTAVAEYAKQSWAPMATVVVRNGVVELWGTITDERERQALIVASANVAGVKTVHDHLVWIEPNSGFMIQSEEDEARGRPDTRRDLRLPARRRIWP
jgi:hypothetical protein